MILTVKSRAVTRALEQYHGMPPVPEDGQPATFGPKRHHGVNYVWHYRGGDAWEVEQVKDDTLADYAERRGPVIELAQQHIGKMPGAELVQMLIQAAISGGITDRAGILDTVQLATNLDAVQQSMETNRDIASIPTEFDDKYIAGVLARHRGPRADRHLWWVDDKKVYHLH